MNFILNVYRKFLKAFILTIVLGIGPIFFLIPFNEAKVQNHPVKLHKVLYAPSSYDRIGILLNKEKEYKYYLFSRKTPIKLDVEGTTELDIKFRLLFDATMKGKQNFTIVIEEVGFLGMKSMVTSYSFRARKSTVSTFQGMPEVVPSRAHKLKLAVPNGKHRYILSIRGTSAQSAAIRISIPKKDLRNPIKKRA